MKGGGEIFKKIKEAFFQVIILVTILAAFATVKAEVVSTTYYHLDALGSPIAATDENGSLKWRENYRPYGDKIELDMESFENSRWYTGHVHDEETGLTYAGARYYDPVVGRFYSNDPLDALGHFARGDFVHGFNRYAYANNNPYKYIDPDGNDSYLVSRPLHNKVLGAVAAHNFVVTNANSIGDPNATVHSFGNRGDGTMGRVTGSTKGPSATTYVADKQAWESANSADHNITLRAIDAPDAKVDSIANSLVENKKYVYTPSGSNSDTANSNSAAGAIANKADGGSTSANGKIQPGHTSARHVEFRGPENE